MIHMIHTTIYKSLFVLAIRDAAIAFHWNLRLIFTHFFLIFQKLYLNIFLLLPMIQLSDVTSTIRKSCEASCKWYPFATSCTIHHQPTTKINYSDSVTCPLIVMSSFTIFDWNVSRAMQGLSLSRLRLNNYSGNLIWEQKRRCQASDDFRRDFNKLFTRL